MLRHGASRLANSLRRTQVPLKHIERFLFVALNQFGLGESEIYGSRVFAPSCSIRLRSKGGQVLLGQAQRRPESLPGFRRMMAAELHLAQGGIKTLREIVVRKRANLRLDARQTRDGIFEST